MSVISDVRIADLRLRGILDSRGRPTVEADLRAGGATGRGSCPVAIAPGRLERRRGVRTGRLGDLTASPAGGVLRTSLVDRPLAGQRELDGLLRELDDRHTLGADVTLAVSLAFARAAAALAGRPLHDWVADLAGTPSRSTAAGEPAMDAAGTATGRAAMPRLLVNAFSGGIHRYGAADSFQQVMLIPRTGGLLGDVAAALAAYAEVERRAGRPPISASSGLLVPGRDTVWQLGTLTAIAADGGLALDLGVDVAAEHLAAGSGRYRFEGTEHPAGAFSDLLVDLARRFSITYVEDPFDPADTASWEAFLPAARAAGVCVVGDDLFASDADRVRPGLADAALLKPSQAGTLTATVEAARAARAAGLRLVVSHRSGETEDTAMCDLAVAIGAAFIKIGGPRRGDRIAKYNQLLRLAEEPYPSGARALSAPTEGESECHVPSSSRK
jgi:enolase